MAPRIPREGVLSRTGILGKLKRKVILLLFGSMLCGCQRQVVGNVEDDTGTWHAFQEAALYVPSNCEIALFRETHNRVFLKSNPDRCIIYWSAKGGVDPVTSGAIRRRLTKKHPKVKLMEIPIKDYFPADHQVSDGGIRAIYYEEDHGNPSESIIQGLAWRDHLKVSFTFVESKGLNSRSPFFDDLGKIFANPK